MRRFQGVMAAVSAAGLAMALAACGGNGGGGGPTQNADGNDEVTVGVIPIVDVAPIYLGKQKGFFSSRGIDLDLVAAQGGAAVIPGVVSEQFQFGFSNLTSLMIAASKKLPLKITNAGDSSTGKPDADFGGVVVTADNPVKKAKDLAGQ